MFCTQCADKDQSNRVDLAVCCGWPYFLGLVETTRAKGWQGALIGVAIGFTVFILAAAIGGYVHASSGT